MKRLGVAVLTLSAAVAAAIGIGAGTANAKNCGTENSWNVSVTSLESCGFGINVARAVDPSSAGGKFDVTAYSPYTQLTYQLTCTDIAKSGQAPYPVAYVCAIHSAQGGAVLLGH